MSNVISVDFAGLSDAQHELRRTGVCASEVAALVGLSPYSTPLDIWRYKVEGLRLEENPAMRRGRLLEPAVAQWYAETTGATLRSPGTLAHPMFSRALATPDRIATLPDGEERLLEIKTASWFQREDWGEEGTDEIPQHYVCQVQWTMFVTEKQTCDVAVLIGGEDFRRYRVERDEELIQLLFIEANRFWVEHVEPKEPPAVDGSKAASEWLASRYPNSKPGLLQATPEAEKWAGVLRLARMRQAGANVEETLAANWLKSLIGEAEGIQGNGWRVTWRRNAKGSRVFRPTFDGEEQSA